MRSMGPLEGVTVLDLGCLGAGAFASMLLADLGADVIRVDRADKPIAFPGPPRLDLLNRGKRSVSLDLKTAEGSAAVRRLARDVDIVVEGFRPGVAERLGIGPESLHEQNDRLVYGRLTGWGQSGPDAQTPGHDINFIAASGVLHAIGEAGASPQIPVNFIGNYAAGGMYAVAGVLAALHVATQTGVGQVVDASMVDGSLHLLTSMHALSAASMWTEDRGTNLLDGGAPFYGVYETSDRRHMAVGALEPSFYASLLSGLDLPLDVERQYDESTWPAVKAALAAAFRMHSQAHWAEVFREREACVTPVLSYVEAREHPQIKHRQSLVTIDGVTQSAVTPRFSQSGVREPASPPLPGEHTEDIMASLRDDAGASAQEGTWE
ncbi:CaiB/BaiF CoA-transferase family protein [Aeromicrobium sp. Leaf350]|uniref:CaiB/BaiF CoA transferase family protein n=1 Tax=Aeromicrobium sp. Leaf350 TaxID=2876565 RepID=UPI001E374C8C|nr:CaiB/BaiF CoA-transferase family protein [Aeromicrobium sp. Leaf350]